MAAAEILERPSERARARTAPRLAVALRQPEPELQARLARLPGIVLVPDASSAEVMVADATLPEPAPEGLPVLVLAEGAAALAALRAGARGVLPPDAPGPVLEAALHALARGLAVLPPGLLPALLGRDAPAPPESGLTRREREVLELLAAGASNKVIARQLGLSFHTAKAHVAAVLQKLGASSRADAVARGARAGLVLL
jgi:DNA-binding NarL/FixJ family response regulator